MGRGTGERRSGVTGDGGAHRETVALGCRALSCACVRCRKLALCLKSVSAPLRDYARCVGDTHLTCHIRQRESSLSVVVCRLTSYGCIERGARPTSHDARANRNGQWPTQKPSSWPLASMCCDVRSQVFLPAARALSHDGSGESCNGRWE